MPDLVMEWDAVNMRFAARGRTSATYENARGDFNTVSNDARLIGSTVVASHILSYALIRDTVINVVNKYIDVLRSRVPDQIANATRTFYMNIAFFSNQVSQSVSTDYCAQQVVLRVDNFISDPNEENFKCAVGIIPQLINLLAREPENLMWGFEKTNRIIESRLDFPPGAFEASELFLTRIEQGVRIRSRCPVIRLTDLYEEKIVALFNSCLCPPGSLAFLVTNMNGNDIVMSSGNSALETQLLNPQPSLTKPSRRIKMFVHDKHQDKWHEFTRYYLDDLPYDIFYLE